MKSAISLVIPTVYENQWQWFWTYNQAVLKTTHLVVVASFAKPLDVLSQQIVWVELEKPLGFAKTVNLGMRHATTEIIGTVNDDVQLPHDWEYLATCFHQDERIGAVNPIIVSKIGQIESAGICVLPRGKAVPLHDIVADQPYPTDAFNGACVLFSRKFLDDVGYFDESFDSYLEDIELSLRGKERGWKMLVEPNVRVLHLKHQTSNKLLGKRKAWLDLRNWWKITLRYTSLSTWLHHGSEILIERIRNVSGLIKTYLS